MSIDPMDYEYGLFFDVIELIANRFGEDPTDLPGKDRTHFHCLLATALLEQATDNDPKKVPALVQKLLARPLVLIPPRVRRGN